MAKNKITAEEFDAKFDAGEDITDYLDLSHASRRTSIDFPIWMLKQLDNEAGRLGVPRQALIKIWLDERLREEGIYSGSFAAHSSITQTGKHDKAKTKSK